LLFWGDDRRVVFADFLQTLTGSQKTNIARHLLIIGRHQTKIGSQKMLTGSQQTNIAPHHFKN
jgi:hypothetical protein